MVHALLLGTRRGARYVDVENARVRGDTGARKPDVAMRFALPATGTYQLHVENGAERTSPTR